MIGKKFIALLVVGGLTASIGITAGAYTNNVSGKTKVNYAQTQVQNKPGFNQVDIKAKLDVLVKAGTITQAAEDAVIANLTQLEAARKVEMDKVNSMTDAQKKTYFESKVNTVKADLFGDLVKSGTLTQAQADAIKAALPMGHGRMGFDGQGKGNRFEAGNINTADMMANMKTKLDTVVKAGTIAQATEDKLLASFTQATAAKKAEMDKVKIMTAAEKKTYMDSKVKVQKTDLFAGMVKSGTLTQTQSDAIKKLFPGHSGGHGIFGGRHSRTFNRNK